MAVIKSGSTTDQAFVTPANALKVDGSGVTQPVSISGTVPVSVSSLPGSPAQDGTDGATPPSIPGTGIRGWLRSIYDRLSNPLAVTGTFFQATQPVSISGTVQTDDVSSANTGAAVPAEAIQIGLNKSGTLIAATADANNNLNVNIADVSGSAAVAKGIQSTGAIPTQDFKDSGRVIKILQATFTPAVAEALVSLTPIIDGVAGTAGTSFTVTAGKRFRLQAIMLTVENATAAIRGTQVIVRMSATGAVTVTSPVIGGVAATTAAATLQLAASQAQSFPDGIELSGAMQVGISAIGTALAGSTVSLIGYEY